MREEFHRDETLVARLPSLVKLCIETGLRANRKLVWLDTRTGQRRWPLACTDSHRKCGCDGSMITDD